MPPAEQTGRLAGLVERLESCLSRLDLDLDEEQGLLESLLRTSGGARPEEALPAVLPLDAHGWSRIVSYAFERRYGWSESADVNDDRAMDSLDNRAKKKINDALDQVTHWPASAVLGRDRAWRVLFRVSAAAHAVTSVHWQTGQLLACLKEHPLLRPIFQAFLSVVCLLLKPLSLPTAPELHASGVHALRPVRLIFKCSWAATEAEAMMAMVAGSCVAEACGAAAVLPVRARLD